MNQDAPAPYSLENLSTALQTIGFSLSPLRYHNGQRDVLDNNRIPTGIAASEFGLRPSNLSASSKARWMLTEESSHVHREAAIANGSMVNLFIDIDKNTRGVVDTVTVFAPNSACMVSFTNYD